MELMRNLRWMCRVCAVNIRKRRSASGAVSIFDTPNLLGKLRTYLQMEVEFHDKLPKSICANCFKRIESVHNFAVLAKKTENFLKDFISIAQKNLEKTTATRISARFQNEFASFALLSSGNKNDFLICEEDAFNGNEDISITIDTDREENERFKSYPEKLQFIEVKKNESRFEKMSDKLRGSSTEEKNSLEQKRKNLKMILANNTSSQPVVQASSKGYNVIIPPTPAASTALSGLQSGEVSNYDCLNLGCVIKDLDLLKLILKALKWPFTKETLNAQIHRLKNTRFRDVMVDPNLLQDTDLMQILSSYLSPILIQPQASNFGLSPGANLNSGIIPSLEAYKIPADTSVHIVSVPLESERRERRQMRQRRYQEILRSKKLRIESPIEILSDDSRDVQTFEVNVDPNWYFPNTESESQENSTESLVMSLVGDMRQQNTRPNAIKTRKKQRRKEAHRRLHTDRYQGQDMVIVNEDGQEIPDSSQNNSQRKEKSNEDLLLDSESLRSQFPLVAIIEENSNDDAMWTQFKVVNSPNHDTNRDDLESRTNFDQGIDSIQMTEINEDQQQDAIQDRSRIPSQSEEIKQEIKQEVIDSYEHPEIKTEPVVEPETILPDPYHEGNNSSGTREDLDESKSMELISIKEEEPEYFEVDEIEDSEANRGKTGVHREIENNEIETGEKEEEVVEEVTEQKATRSKSAGNFSNQLVDSVQSKTAMTTRSSSRNLANNKRTPQSVTPRTYPAAKRGKNRVGRPSKRC